MSKQITAQEAIELLQDPHIVFGRTCAEKLCTQYWEHSDFGVLKDINTKQTYTVLDKGPLLSYIVKRRLDPNDLWYTSKKGGSDE